MMNEEQIEGMEKKTSKQIYLCPFGSCLFKREQKFFCRYPKPCEEPATVWLSSSGTPALNAYLASGYSFRTCDENDSKQK